MGNREKTHFSYFFFSPPGGSKKLLEKKGQELFWPTCLEAPKKLAKKKWTEFGETADLTRVWGNDEKGWKGPEREGQRIPVRWQAGGLGPARNQSWHC